MRYVVADGVIELPSILDYSLRFTQIAEPLPVETLLRLHWTPVGEIGIQTVSREFGTGSTTSMAKIIRTIRDMLRMRKKIFSDTYHLPDGRERG